MQLYIIEQGGCCHPNLTYVVANSIDEACELVSSSDLEDYDYSDPKFVSTLDMDIHRNTTPRILKSEGFEQHV